MRTISIFLLSLGLAGCSAHMTVRTGEGAAAEVNAATAAWVEAYNSRDPARIVALYDRDAVLWGTAAPVIRTTPEAVADYFKDAGKRPNARVAIVEQNVRVIGDAAVSAGAYTFSDVVDGKPNSRPSRYSFVYRYRDGKWMIVHHHSSRMPAP